jgi:hypothetical protein
MMIKYYLPGIVGIGFSIPFVIKTIKNIIFALQPHTYGGTSGAIIYGSISVIVLFFSVRSLKNAKIKQELHEKWAK